MTGHGKLLLCSCSDPPRYFGPVCGVARIGVGIGIAAPACGHRAVLCCVCGCGSVAVEENREVLVTGHLRASDTPLAAVQLGHSGECDPVRLWEHGVGPFMERKVSLVFGAVGVNEGGCASGHGVPRCSVHFV
jgi:hypothetical protein